MRNAVKYVVEYFISNDIFIWLYLRLRKQKSRIILYHGVSDLEHEKKSYQVISKETFEKQMAYLKKHYVIIPLSQVLKARDAGEKLSQNTITITFDDGYENNYSSALAILNKFDFTASIFVSPDFIDQSQRKERKIFWWDIIDYLATEDNCDEFISIFEEVGIKLQQKDNVNKLKNEMEKAMVNAKPDIVYEVTEKMKKLFTYEIAKTKFPAVMNWVQLEQMRLRGIEIGTHTMSHCNVAELPASMFGEELIKPKQTLEAKLGQKIETFAFPFGGQENYSKEAISALKQAGYKCALLVTGKENDPFCFSRTSIAKSDDFRSFKMKVSGIYDEIRSIYEYINKFRNSKRK